ncbi:hypothetical protein [Marinomonas pollencensis]|uniref:Uncharacterized protein n=1 Tax=Marinomonas pollencensis TaxID=491954 RepID=A0A3E0DJV0_9GAMM|nr:hypothetical protein [Marinomonas pollencensis]REG82902.1 hypothetical protein DFP81_10776 [Marinomonas pollencensis]
MKYLAVNWKLRVTIIFLVSICISSLLIALDQTGWAAQINQQGFSHGEEGGKPNFPVILIYILPFIKEIVLMGVPMLLALLVMKVSSSITAKLRNMTR